MPHQCTSCARQFADGSKEMLSGCPDCGGTKFQFMPNGGAPAAEEPPSPPERGTGTVTETVGHVATKLRDFVGDDPGSPKRRSTGDPGGSTTEVSRGTSTEESGGTSTEDVESTTAEDVEGTTTAAMASTGVTNGAGTQSGGGVETDAAAESGAGAGSATAAESGSVDESGPAGTDDATPDEGSAGGSLLEQDGAGSDESDTDDTAHGPEDGAQSTARSEMVSPDELPDGPAYVGTENDGDLQPTNDQSAESEGRVVDTPADESPDLADLREELNDQFEGIRITEPGQYELNLMELYEREETIIALQENGRYVIEPPESWRGDESV